MSILNKDLAIDVIFDPQKSKETVFSINGGAYYKNGGLFCDHTTDDYIKLRDNPELFSWRLVTTPDSTTEKFWATTSTVKLCSASSGTVTMTGFSIYVNGVLDDPIVAGKENEIVGIATSSFTYAAIEIGKGLHGSISTFQVFKSVMDTNSMLNKYQAREYKEFLTSTRILDVDGRDGIIGNRLEGDIVGSELITNGSFTGSATGWVLGSGFTYNNNAIDSVTGTGLDQNGILGADKYYLVTFELSNSSAGVMRVELGTTTSGTYGTDGVHSVIKISNGTDFKVNCLGSYVGTIDNVSVIELIPAVTNTSVVSVRDGSIRANYYNESAKLDCGNYDDLTGDKTFIAWIKPYSFGETTAGRIFNNGKVDFFVNDANDTIGFSSNASLQVNSASNSIVLGLWHLAIVTRTSAGITNFYVNGILSGSADQDSGTPAAGTTNIIIGDRDADARGFYGLINQNRIENSILTAQEAMQVFTSERGQYSV